ncbi:MAG: hypothetical protein DRJ03_01520 [Chloroflexi bacterium]|nr:MAG: hypothetical protein DRJ03_01520 [Chloroflexota bacterium]
MAEKETPAALQVAKAEKHRIKAGDTVTLSSGYRAIVRPVSSRLIMEAQRSVKDPKPPMQDVGKGRKEPNYDHPEYRAAMLEAEEKRSEAVSDIVLLFGVDLVDGVPKDDGWLKKLRQLERMGTISLEGYDLESSADREYVFKKYVAVNPPDVRLIGMLASVTPEEVDAAIAGFPGD